VRVEVADRVPRRHPEITKADVEYAWLHYRHLRPRFWKNPTQYTAIGFDISARVLEMIAVLDLDEETGEKYYLVFHAMACTRGFEEEMRLDYREIAYLLGREGHGSYRGEWRRHH
jgi:hypothetical protein